MKWNANFEAPPEGDVTLHADSEFQSELESLDISTEDGGSDDSSDSGWLSDSGDSGGDSGSRGSCGGCD